MIQLIYSSSKGIFRSTTVCFQTVHFLEMQIKKWIVLEEKERHDFACSRESSWISWGFSHILLHMLIYCKVSVSNIFLKPTNELSKAICFEHIASKENNMEDYFGSLCDFSIIQTKHVSGCSVIKFSHSSEFERISWDGKREINPRSGGEKRFLLFFIRRLILCATPMVEGGNTRWQD